MFACLLKYILLLFRCVAAINRAAPEQILAKELCRANTYRCMWFSISESLRNKGVFF